MKQNRKRESFFTDDSAIFKYNGFVDEAYRFVLEKQLLKPDLWKKFVDQFRTDADIINNGWRGEYWGKTMRGASLCYSYTKDEELYDILKTTIIDMIESGNESGRISSYSVEKEFNGWDMWCRKYVMLGMEYFLEICKDGELKDRIISSLRSQADYIISKIGEEEGKIAITATTDLWRGVNSSSILESFVRLYALTNDEKYLKFSRYIIELGACEIENIFNLAFENELYPYQYPVTKAYELISCFEGLLEYYIITGDEKSGQTVVNFADKILESDFTVIGSCGCTEELFDHSTVRQANTTNSDFSQETCVTVTLMKFMNRIYKITGDPKYIDAFETSFYNAYLGTFNTGGYVDFKTIKNTPECIMDPMPFDSYSPLVWGARGTTAGGKQVMADNSYYGCCACIGSAGVGMLHKTHVLGNEHSIAINMFIDGTVKTKTPNGEPIIITTKTLYPKDGNVEIYIDVEKNEDFEILIRNPYWSKNTTVKVNGTSETTADGYITLKKQWSKGDKIELCFDMRTTVIRPVPYDSQVLMNKVIWDHNYIVPTFDREDPIARNHIALRRGPIMLATETRLGNENGGPLDIAIGEDGTVDSKESTTKIPFECIVKVDVPLSNGEFITLTDYSSAGRVYDGSVKMAVWIRNS